MQKQLDFIDAQVQHAVSPGTFDLPTDAAVAALRKGDFIKIGVRFAPVDGNIQGERFWVQLTGILGSNYVGKANNDLVYTAEHGISCDDTLSVQRKHILAVLYQPPATAF